MGRSMLTRHFQNSTHPVQTIERVNSMNIKEQLLLACLLSIGTNFYTHGAAARASGKPAVPRYAINIECKDGLLENVDLLMLINNFNAFKPCRSLITPEGAMEKTTPLAIPELIDLVSTLFTFVNPTTNKEAFIFDFFLHHPLESVIDLLIVAHNAGLKNIHELTTTLAPFVTKLMTDPLVINSFFAGNKRMYALLSQADTFECTDLISPCIPMHSPYTAINPGLTADQHYLCHSANKLFYLVQDKRSLTVSAHKTATENPNAYFFINIQKPVDKAAVNPDGSCIIFSFNDGSVQIHQSHIDHKKTDCTTISDMPAVTDITFNAIGNAAVITLESGKQACIDQYALPAISFRDGTNSYMHNHISDQEQRVAAQTNEVGTHTAITVWDTHTNTQATIKTNPKGFKSLFPVRHLTFSPNGKLLAFTHNDILHLYSVAASNEKLVPKRLLKQPLIFPLHHLSFSACGTYLAITEAGRLHIINCASINQAHMSPAIQSPSELVTVTSIKINTAKQINALAFSPDALTIAVAFDSKNVQLVHVTHNESQELRVTQGGNFSLVQPISALTFSPDGASLLVAYGNKVAQFNTTTQKVDQRLMAKCMPVESPITELTWNKDKEHVLIHTNADFPHSTALSLEHSIADCSAQQRFLIHALINRSSSSSLPDTVHVTPAIMALYESLPTAQRDVLRRKTNSSLVVVDQHPAKAHA